MSFIERGETTVKTMRNALHTLILGMATVATAQSGPAPNLELRLHPGALVDGVPDSFTFEIVNISKRDVRVPQPTVLRDSYSSFVWLHYRFKPLRPSTELSTGFGCAADKMKWPAVLERANEWQLLRPGESVSKTLPQAKLHYESREPGTYEFWAGYTPPVVSPEDRKAIRNAKIDFAAAPLSTPHLTFTRLQ
jgi:hypothetical protein